MTCFIRDLYELKYKNPRRLKECIYKYVKCFEEYYGYKNPHA